jgi:TolB-like protein
MRAISFPWLLIQIATATFPVLEIPNIATKLVIVVLILGFPIALVIAWAFEMTPEGMKRTDEVPHDTMPRWSRKKFIALIAIAAMAAGGLLTWQVLRGPIAPPKQDEAATVSQKSIAVLPFENLSHDPENAYFASGTQDEILTRLAKIDDLKVIPRTSTQRYKSSPGNLPAIAKEIGVAHILEGSVQKSADQVRVVVQLIHATSDAHVWAETYDRKLTDIFAVESDIADDL